MKKKLAITLGDPLSINIEMLSRCLDLYATGKSKNPRDAKEISVQVIGSLWHWNDQRARLPFVPNSVDHLIEFTDVGSTEFNKPAEQLNAQERGILAVRALEYLRKENSAQAVLTGPIDKHACQQAGFSFPGQTEFFADLWGGQGIMVLAGDRLRVGIATNHLALRDVPDAVSTELIVTKARLLAETLTKYFHIRYPKIAVCGLNPHCGDGGMFGTEDEKIVRPAVGALTSLHSSLAEFSGPWPADTCFYEASQGRFDGVLALYHDQGLGPLKVLHFDNAINITGGLRHVRVSPDHGPARSHYLKGTASPSSFLLAWQLLVRFLSEGTP